MTPSKSSFGPSEFVEVPYKRGCLKAGASPEGPSEYA